MPLYEFQCAKGHVHTELVKLYTDKRMCPQCKPSYVWALRILSPSVGIVTNPAVPRRVRG